MANNPSTIFFKVFKTVILVAFMIFAILVGYFTGSVIAVAKDAPDIDPHTIISSLNENSIIVDQEGNLIEKVETVEYREVIKLDQMPTYLKDAFISVEDERFIEHGGVDFVSVVGSIVDNLKAGEIERGASSITQQLARNMYLTNEVSFDRKIKEMYLAIQIDQALTKDEILEAYLNRVFLGQNSYGVQAASEMYFSKNASELTLAEAATLAGVVKSPSNLALFKTYRPSEVTDQKVIGELTIGNELYYAVYNPLPDERKDYVLKKMVELGKISEAEYTNALAEDVSVALKPGVKRIDNLSNYFTDLMKVQVVEKLMELKNIPENEAKNILYNGGLTIYSSIDVEMQRQLEDIYANFSKLVNGNTSGRRTPPIIDWSLSKTGNILNDNGEIIYYKRENLLDDAYNLVIGSDAFTQTESGLILDTQKLNLYGSNLNVADFYTRDDNSNLLTHTIGNIPFEDGQILKQEDGTILITSDFIAAHPDFHHVNEEGSLIISNAYFVYDSAGVVQPQASTVVIDHKTGQIKAIMGGRDQSGQKILNRASAAPRQPGSSMKPIATYTPALDNGYSLATPIDDVPFRNDRGEIWPRNVYRGYKGLKTLRESVELSININAVKTLQTISISKSKEYLEKFGIIDADNPANDSFITAAENSAINDENLAAMGLGAMTDGITNLDLTGAYAALANLGTYIEPLSFTKIVDTDGNVLFDNNNKTNEVVNPQVAFLMNDALRTAAQKSVAQSSQIGGGIQVAGKTGTTNEDRDYWFVGFTPYYTVGVWIGCDNAQINLEGDSGVAAKFWSIVNKRILDGYDSAELPKPEGLVRAKVCKQSGQKPTSLCSGDPRGGMVITEYFASDNVPTKSCDVHVSRKIDSRNGLLASNTTPSEFITSRVFIDRQIDYDPSKFNGIVPDDWSYHVPTRYSTEESTTTETETETETTTTTTVETTSSTGTTTTTTTTTPPPTEPTTTTTSPPSEPTTVPDPTTPVENPSTTPEQPSVPPIAPDPSTTGTTP